MPHPSDPNSRMLAHVRKMTNETYDRRDAFRKMYLEEPNGCIPDELMGEELLYDVKNKFYWPMDAVRVQLEKEFGTEQSMWVYVDPTYEDTTWALLTLDNRHVLLTYCEKAWKFWFEGEAEMRKELRQWYRKAKERYLEVAEK